MAENEEPNERKFLIRSPGKLIITGEHAVVYGKLALAASIDLFTEFHFTLHSPCVDSPIISIHFENFAFKCSIPLEKLPVSNAADSSQFDGPLLERLKSVAGKCIPPDVDQSIETSLLAVCYLYCSIVRGDRRHSFDLVVTSKIPTGAGLGSSAAFAVAASGAFHLLNHLIASPQPYEADLAEINSSAFHCETMFHATPSGIDNAVCTYGGLVKFQERRVAGSLDIPEASILLVDTGKSRQTKLLVEGVRKKRDRLPQVVDPILEAIDRISHEMTDVIVNPPERSYQQVQVLSLNGALEKPFHISHDCRQELLTMNHWLLASLGVSHATLDDIQRIAQTNGQAAKLTGAGGGGLAFVWLDPNCSEQQLNALKAKLQSNDPPYKFWPARLGVKGLEIQQIL